MSDDTNTLDGCTIIGTLLRGDAGIINIVPATNIAEGAPPRGAQLPIILIESTSSVEPGQPLVRGAAVMTVDRVAVTIRAASHRDRKRIRALVVACCAGKTGSIAGASNVSVLTAGAGPDLRGPADSFDRTQDFRVFYNA